MIELQVEDYCQKCPNFEPRAEKLIERYPDAVICNLTIVRCEHLDMCRHIYKSFIERQERKVEQ